MAVTLYVKDAALSVSGGQIFCSLLGLDEQMSCFWPTLSVSMGMDFKLEWFCPMETDSSFHCLTNQSLAFY